MTTDPYSLAALAQPAMLRPRQASACVHVHINSAPQRTRAKFLNLSVWLA